MRQTLMRGIWIACAVVASHVAANAEVVLTSKDGLSSLKGTIVAVEDDTYTIETSIGTLLVDAALVDCEGVDCPDYEALDQLVRVAGPQSLITELLPSLLDSYALKADADSVAVNENGSSGRSVILRRGADRLATFELSAQSLDAAFADLLTGRVEMVVSDRRISNQELDAFEREGLGNLTSPSREAIIALDGIAPIVSGSNPVKRLNMGQLAEVFSGSATNWSQFGGNDAPINVYLPDDDGTMAGLFEQTLLEPEFLTFTSSAQRVPRVSDIYSAVSRDPNGIGIASLSKVDRGRQVSLIANCGLAVPQNRFAVKAEDYPFSRRIYVYTTDRRLPSHTLKFVESAKASSTRLEASDAGFIGLEPEMSDIGDYGNQLAFSLADPSQAGELANLRDFAQAVLGAGRLSVTFRFGLGSSQLDNKASSDALRLSQLLSTPQFANREVLLIGFTDSIGDSEVNKVLSVRRAQQVLAEVNQQAENANGLRRVRTLGFGSAFPVACNTSETGRQMNRRVEVWVR